MAEKKIDWTDQQKSAINARGGDVVVTASAGTGKTAVLSGRCVNIIANKSICPDVGSILVLTFTEAAAEQMRLRIAGQLRDAFLEKRDAHIRRQLMLLQSADISTIHSFCKRLITEYFYRLGLDPTFGVIDADEQKLLKTEVLEKTIDEVWRQSSIRGPLEQLLYRRDLRANDGFLTRIIELSDFLDGVVSREKWYKKAAKLAAATDPFATYLGEQQKQIVAGKCRSILNKLNHSMKLCESQGGDASWDQKLKDSHVAPVTECIEILKTGDWDKCAEAIMNFQKPTTRKPKGLLESTAALIQSIARNAMTEFAELSELAILNPDYHNRISGLVGPQTGVLIEFIKTFDQLYNKAKRSVCLDFADLEHYALRLLSDQAASDDEVVPSQTALALRQKYKHISVDEYQDINAVQQRILEMLSPGGNVLRVGDSKQSIYAFRGAMPDIFLEQVKQSSSEAAKASKGFRVDLNVNFRSKKIILDFVNDIFSRIMTESFSKIDYDESSRLKPPPAEQSETPIPDGKQNIIEFHILDKIGNSENSQAEQAGESEVENRDIVTSRKSQAAMIAKRIKQMVGADTGKAEFQIKDEQMGIERDVEYRDIVVLMRSLAKKANDYVEIFRLDGVPVSCQTTAGYFEATEINDFVALLKVLDNPQRDIELAAVLRSPIFKVTDTELAMIKLENKTQRRHISYYDCVLEYCRSGSDAGLAGRLEKILSRVEQWRTVARRGKLADLIWRIYRQTDFLSFVSALPNGEARRANLLKLHDRAIQYENFAGSAVSIPSLTRFVEFIEKLQETGQDWAPAEPQSSAGNAVRILSVHKSKGLEFPVVFLAELESKFNKRDIQADCLIDVNHTLGLQIIERESNSKLSSLAHQVIQEEKKSTGLAEEMRILYVSTTRAKERLILTASEKHNKCRQIISNGFFFGEKPVPGWQLRTCQNPLEWILYALSDRKILHDAFDTGLAEETTGKDLFNFILHNHSDLRQLAEYIIRLKKGKPTRSKATSKKSRSKQKSIKLFAQVKKSLDFRYRFSEAASLPAKSSVTQLSHGNDEYIKYDYTRAIERQPNALIKADTDSGISHDGRLIGIATHLIISELDLAGSITKEAIKKKVEQLLADGAILPAVAEQIDAESILAFFDSELGRLTLNKANTVWREWPFTFALPASEWENSSVTEDTIVVQGIIDLLVRTAQGVVVIDFKTDKIKAGQAQERAELYRRQLELYSKAACAILKNKPAGKWLYFMNPRVFVKV